MIRWHHLPALTDAGFFLSSKAAPPSAQGCRQVSQASCAVAKRSRDVRQSKIKMRRNRYYVDCASANRVGRRTAVDRLNTIAQGGRPRCYQGNKLTPAGHYPSSPPEITHGRKAHGAKQRRRPHARRTPAASRRCRQQPQGARTAVTRLVCYLSGGSMQSEPARLASQRSG